MPDDDSSSATTSSATSNPKSKLSILVRLNPGIFTPRHYVMSAAKVRRLYDIANVLTTLELIRKKTFLAPNHRKMPGYVWCGPNMADINAVCEFCACVYILNSRKECLLCTSEFGSYDCAFSASCEGCEEC